LSHRPCKARKVKCIRLNWGGRTKREKSTNLSDASSTASGSPYQTTLSFDDDVSPLFPPQSEPQVRPVSHVRSHSNISPPRPNIFMVDPELLVMSQSRTPPLTSTAGSYEFHESTMGLPTSAPFHQSQFQNTFDFPIIPTSAGGQFGYSTSTFPSMNVQAPLSPPSMPPPQRHQYSYSMDSPPTTMSDAHSPYTGPPTPYSPYMAMPLTPQSSVSSEEPVMRTAPKQRSSAYTSPDLRRMSVQSIINNDYSEHQHSHHAEHGRQYPIADFSTTTYGYDLGLPDLDTPNNEDFSAITLFSPQAETMEYDDDSSYDHAEPRSNDMAFESEGYYAKPVPIRISKSLGTLPPILMENPMNLLYFHHFLNHTARILVPHDCERNPFRQILPEMAVGDENIMNLLLAYSAAHRARMLNHPEPSNRIAVWVQDVFPKLRQSLLEDPNNISDNTLAAVIMMASLEIISSGTFEVPISWQSHLTMARQMIIGRGGPRGMGRQDRVAYFLSRWFAYLDVLGSLSGNKNDMPLGSSYWSSQNAVADEDFEIDCLMGFTTRCVGSLARISELAKMCEPQRIDDEGNVRKDWIPSPEVVQQAVQIRRQLEEGLLERNIRKGCSHGAWDTTEIYATNEMFHWAGLIHLYRRVLGKPANDPEVQNAVREIAGLLNQIRRGSTAEACLMFPMFAAGCDTQDRAQKVVIMERLRSVEGFGMNHTPKIATLLQSVWDTGKPWESLVSGEFFG
ncbi:hypothetical protein EK21DRAFT_56079, partial [Setomelanomma holmii]